MIPEDCVESHGLQNITRDYKNCNRLHGVRITNISKVCRLFERLKRFQKITRDYKR